MSNFSEIENNQNSRRNFIKTTTALAGFCLLNCDTLALPVKAPKIDRALDDENIISGKVKFKSDDGEIDAFLSRPSKKGRYPIVIVVSGNTYDEEYIQN